MKESVIELKKAIGKGKSGEEITEIIYGRTNSHTRRCLKVRILNLMKKGEIKVIKEGVTFKDTIFAVSDY